MARGMVAAPPCTICGSPAARLEVVAPGELPAQWEQWRVPDRDSFLKRYRESTSWHVLYEGVDGEAGLGTAVDASQAEKIAAAFESPLSYARVRTADLYDDAGFCAACDAPYCYRHWRMSGSGLGRCPRGHGKSLAPHRLS